MNPSYRLNWITVLLLFLPLVLLITLIAIFWWIVTPHQLTLLPHTFHSYLLYFLGSLGALALLFGLGMLRLFHRQVFPAIRLAEEAELIRTGNPSHRINSYGSPAIKKLSGVINDWADRLEADQVKIETLIAKARSSSETEKNILAAFLAELPEGVLVCNLKGKILLYNKQAKRFLADGHKKRNATKKDSTESYQYVGLGRWVFDVLDQNLIRHALDEIKMKLKNKEPDFTAYFVFSQKERVFRVEAAPILDHLRDLTGYILIFYNITKQMQADGRVQFLWQALTRQVRSTMTSVRSAVETLLAYPDLTEDRKNRLKQLIQKESVHMGNVLDNTIAEYDGCCNRSRWPLFFIKDLEFLEIIAKRATDKMGIDIRLAKNETFGWIRVDTYSISLAIVFIIHFIKATTGREQFNLRLKRAGRFIALDILWMGAPFKVDQLKRLENQTVTIGTEALPFTIKEIIGYHHMDIGTYPGRTETNPSHVRIFMPAYSAPEPIRKRSVAILPESRPAFFDFDLFQQPGQHPDLDARHLDAVTYTVFDLETTGLDINGGDRVVSIGAVRIVNGKLLADEKFSHLINPEMPIPESSTAFHGITDEMVVGQPPIEEVLPRFYDFCDETVLIAHNAAFDMRLLQINEPLTGLKFDHPVLDTLLLSAVVHPSVSEHNLEMIAKRLGVEIHQRHTAMGDALMAAEIFLKLLPLLAKKGIYSLKEAREASQQTHYARLKY